MKRLVTALGLGIIALGMSSCSFVKGNGKVISETRPLTGFTAIRTGGAGKLTVSRGPFKVQVTTDSSVMPSIVTEVVGTELRIYPQRGISIVNPSKLEYEVSLPELNGLSISGSGQAQVGEFSGPDLHLELSGSGGIQGKLSYENVVLSLSGSGVARLQGSYTTMAIRESGSGHCEVQGGAEALNLRISGSGGLMAQEATFGTCDAVLSGSGSASLRVSKALKARLSGSGSLRYWGNPELDAASSGSASVKKAGD